MIGQKISHYRITEKLGEGGMGVVYKATDERLDRSVAIKFLPNWVSDQASAKKRFAREAKTASSLEHPNICAIYDIGETNEGHMFIVMPHYEGETLAERIGRGPSGIDDAVAIMVQLASGMAKAHEKGIVHRDIKPGNVLVGNDGHARILDFGLAKLSAGTRVTRTGTTLGTVAYMSPEQARGETVDPRSDVFSLGVVFYELVSGRLPFRAEHDQAVLYKILNEDPEPLSAHGAEPPGAVQTILDKALTKDPKERYRDASDFLSDLKRLQSGETLPAATSGRGVQVRPVPAEDRSSPAVASPRRVIRSLAVLPLANLSGDPKQAFVADGMTEALIAALAKIRDLKVISRTSVMKYKDTSKSLPDIARELGVDAIVEGSVLYAGDRVRITIQLIDAVTDAHLWAANYDRDLRDVLSLFTEVAQAVVQEFEIKWTSEEKARAPDVPPANTKAQIAYLKGRHHWNRRTKTDLKRCIGYFKEAIDENPLYATAYAGLADAYIMMGNFALLAPKVAFPAAKQAALKALELDESLAEAHASLGAVRGGFDWDLPASKEDLCKAIDINPNYAGARQWLAEVLAAEGHFDEAHAEIAKAQELDPLSSVVRATAGWIFYLSRQHDRAIHSYKEALDLDPNFALAHLYLALALEQKNIADRALEEHEAALAFSGEHVDFAAHLARAYGLFGKPDRARTIREDLLKQSGESYVAAFNFALIHLGLGETDEAFECFNKACEERSDALVFIRVHPIFDPLRSDSRFEGLLRRVGFSE